MCWASCRAGQWDGRQSPAESPCQLGNHQLTQQEEPTRPFIFFTSIKWVCRGSEGSQESQPMYPSHHPQCLQEPLKSDFCALLWYCPHCPHWSALSLLAKWAGKSPNNMKTRALPLTQNFRVHSLQQNLFYSPPTPRVNAEPVWSSHLVFAVRKCFLLHKPQASVNWRAWMEHNYLIEGQGAAPAQL